MRWVLGGRSDGIAETARCKNCVEGREQFKKGISTSRYSQRETDRSYLWRVAKGFD